VLASHIHSKSDNTSDQSVKPLSPKIGSAGVYLCLCGFVMTLFFSLDLETCCYSLHVILSGEVFLTLSL
jgi:hypothetical protein